MVATKIVMMPDRGWSQREANHELSNTLACQAAAKKAGVNKTEAEYCDDGSRHCPTCPWPRCEEEVYIIHNNITGHKTELTAKGGDIDGILASLPKRKYDISYQGCKKDIGYKGRDQGAKPYPALGCKR